METLIHLTGELWYDTDFKSGSNVLYWFRLGNHTLMLTEIKHNAR